MDKRIIMRWWQVPRDGDPGRTARSGSTGSSTGGSGSTPGSQRTGRRMLSSGRSRRSERSTRPALTQDFLAASSSTVDRLGRVVGRGHRVRLLGRVGERLVGRGAAGVVGRLGPAGGAAPGRARASGCTTTASCRWSTPPRSFLKIDAADGGEAGEEEQLLQLAALLLRLVTLDLGQPWPPRQVATERRPSRRRWRRRSTALSAAIAAPSARAGPALALASASTGAGLGLGVGEHRRGLVPGVREQRQGLVLGGGDRRLDLRLGVVDESMSAAWSIRDFFLRRPMAWHFLSSVHVHSTMLWRDPTSGGSPCGPCEDRGRTPRVDARTRRTH